MKTTIDDTRLLLQGLLVEIERGHFQPAKKSRSAVGWKGPGVTFATRISVGRGPSFSLGPEPRSVLTPHAHSAGMLLDRIREAFRPLLGSHIQFDFFERIAEAADEYSAFIPADQDTAESLLKVILREARDILDEMERGDFPSIHSEENED
jgi:hypothetical protein